MIIHIMSIHPFPSTWSMQKRSKSVCIQGASTSRDQVSLLLWTCWCSRDLHNLNGGSLRARTKKSVITTKTDIDEGSRETWRQIMSETWVSTSTTRSALRKGKRATLAKMRNCHGVPNYQFVSCGFATPCVILGETDVWLHHIPHELQETRPLISKYKSFH